MGSKWPNGRQPVRCVRKRWQDGEMDGKMGHRQTRAAPDLWFRLPSMVIDHHTVALILDQLGVASRGIPFSHPSSARKCEP